MTNKEALAIFNAPYLATDQGLDEAEALAKQALESQTPKKPFYFQNEEVNYHCPACDHIIKASNFGNAFCSNCGQALDWSETE